MDRFSSFRIWFSPEVFHKTLQKSPNLPCCPKTLTFGCQDSRTLIVRDRCENLKASRTDFPEIVFLAPEPIYDHLMVHALHQ